LRVNLLFQDCWVVVAEGLSQVNVGEAKLKGLEGEKDLLGLGL
jgi:hypothetical protein